jgi:hypothetical protein
VRTAGTRRLHVEVDGQDVTGMVNVPVTGGWQNWADVKVSGVPLTAGVHQLRMVVHTYGVNVNYIDVTRRANQLPVAVADTIDGVYTAKAGDRVTLTGSSSYDPDNHPSGGIQSYSWIQTAGPSVALTDPDTMHPELTPSEAGVYTFKLTVNDGADDSTNTSSPNNTVTITVEADTAPPALEVTGAVIKGMASDDSGTVSLSVDGQAVSVAPDGTWQKEVVLTGPQTTVQIQAIDANGNVTLRTVQVNR